MALSQSVEQSLKDAESHIRNALAYSARQERAETTYQIAQILTLLDRVIKVDAATDTLENFMSQFKNMGK